MDGTLSLLETTEDVITSGVDEITTVATFLSNTVDNGIGNVINTTASTVSTLPNFTWIIQTITPPPTVIISSDYGYYYLYSFYCCISLLFLVSMILLSVKLSTMRQNAKKATVQRCDATVTYNSNVNANTTVNANTSGGATGFYQQSPTGLDDLPPKYEDLGITNAAMDMTHLDMV